MGAKAKKARLFYLKEGCDAFIPVPDNSEDLLDIDCLEDGEILTIFFRRTDMTDEEFDSLPED